MGQFRRSRRYLDRMDGLVGGFVLVALIAVASTAACYEATADDRSTESERAKISRLIQQP